MGQRLWPQIDKEISDPSRCDGWAIYATQNSLSSEPCREELAYALRRALDSRGAGFPLIGIFPQPIDPILIPGALATRLYVSLNDVHWADRVVAGLRGAAMEAAQAAPLPFVIARHDFKDKGAPFILEIRPRAGRWYPAKILVPSAEYSKLQWVVVGPSGAPPRAAMTSVSDASSVEYRGKQLFHAVDALSSLYAGFSDLPTRVAFGQAGGVLYLIEP